MLYTIDPFPSGHWGYNMLLVYFFNEFNVCISKYLECKDLLVTQMIQDLDFQKKSQNPKKS